MKKIILTAGLIVSFVIVQPLSAQDESGSQISFEQLRLFTQVISRVKAQYVEDVSDEQVIEDAIRGLLAGLDPHSGYISPEAYDDMRIQTRGEYAGVGIDVTQERGALRVISPIDDTPAARAGIQPNDYITHIDDEPLVNLSLDEAVNLMRGPAGTAVSLTIFREDVDEPIELTLVREVIRIKVVTQRVERDDVGYIRISTFNNERLTADVEQAYEELVAQAGSLSALIIDVRNNPGGLLTQAIGVSDLFLDSGEIVSIRGRNSEEDQRWNARRGDLAQDLPIVILTNAGSASASEILVGALQDHERATIIGDRTFGKGVVQDIIPLGPDRALRLTTARYYTPSGRSIQAVGIDPHILIDLTGNDEEESFFPRRESDLDGHISTDEAANGEEESVIRAVIDGSGAEIGEDFVLNYALDYLKGTLRVADAAE